MLSCRTPSDTARPEGTCCRLAPFHQDQTTHRSRRYPSDTTDAQWTLIDPLLPDPAWLTGRGGRPERHCRRAVVDAIFYVVDNGIKWRALPSDFPPWSTVYNHFLTWEKTAITQDLLDILRDRVRLAAGRHPEPTAAIIDSATVKAAETVGRASRGYDGGKKINGRKRHIAVDTQGLLLGVLVTAASIQDRVAARPLLHWLKTTSRRITLVWADGGYLGTLLGWATHVLGVTVEVVKRSDDTSGFVVLPRRWVVERTLAWIVGHRRCARDYERLPQHHEAMVRWSIIRITSRRLTQQT